MTPNSGGYFLNFKGKRVAEIVFLSLVLPARRWAHKDARWVFVARTVL